MITKKYFKLLKVSYADSEYFRIKNISDEVGNFSITKTGSPNATLEYSLNGVDWVTYDMTNLPTVSVNPGANMYLRGTFTNGNSSRNYTINFDKNFNISGNINSLTDKVNFETTTTFYSLTNLFYNQTHLIDTSGVNFGHVTSVGGSGMLSIFRGCTSLTTTPDLSNITSVGGEGMRYMFNGCTSLTTGPDLSNVTSVGNNGMYGMFTGCTSLTTGPDLSNITSVDINGMVEMFKYCSNLTTVYALNTSTWVPEKTWNWLSGVAASGTLYCPSQTVADAIPNNNTSGCPANWTKTIL